MYHLSKKFTCVPSIIENIYKIIEKKKQHSELYLTSISWPIQAKDTFRLTAQTTANAMHNGETAKVRYDTAPKTGTLMYDSPARLNHLCKYE